MSMKRVHRSKKCAITRRKSGSAKLAMISSSGESRTCRFRCVPTRARVRWCVGGYARGAFTAGCAMARGGEEEGGGKRKRER